MSSTSSKEPVPCDDVIVTPQSDLTVEIIEYDEDYGHKVPSRTGLLHISKDTLASSSSYFQAMLGRSWVESKSDKIVLHDDPVRSMEIWFRLFHSTLNMVKLDDVTVTDIWHVILASDKYEFDRQQLLDWFITWYRNATAVGIYRNNLARKLMLPCYAFDYAEGFQVLTKSLVYKEIGHITEISPIDNMKLHLPPRIIQQLNAARGRLRNILDRELFAKINLLIDHGSCRCKEETVFNYLRELGRIDVQPLVERSFSRASVQCYLDRLRQFDQERMLRKISGDRCLHCCFDWKKGVERAIQVTTEYFDGLCLDCMKITVRDDEDYWDHARFRERYDRNCRITHGEPTCYFSFMARREKRGLVAP
ncbi:hypothetical protein BDV37DRAFT_288834 [Aspergillus pseudonomiae]|uniref:BTB domain-containing protein n=1 Tax=Aspergillus pseudonomiae TaxID=1506151 RepID=A0A5N7CWZ8_9EURO|nr:uncharacterized protein BDV37DRAFT_288834 [Aspergillus pseudonomiae]KAE8398123.1 hypothetical protein BDV37DRAFT_288834 [Aspergillus pseudonomiae]